MILPRHHSINVLRYACMVALVDNAPRRTVDFFLAKVAGYESARTAKPVGLNWPARTIKDELDRRGTDLRQLAEVSGIEFWDIRTACVRSYRNSGLTPAHAVIAAALGETVERVFPETVAISAARRAA